MSEAHALRLAGRMSSIPASPFLAVLRAARQVEAAGRNVLYLSMGEPDFDTPPNIRSAGIRAIETGQTRYTAMDGTPALKEAIRHKLKRDNRLEYRSDEVTVTLGGTQAIFNAMMATVGPGDEVVLPAPFFQPYLSAIHFAGGTPVVVQCKAENGFVPTAEQIDAAITPRTRWIILNSPSNPTGAVIDADALAALAEVIRRHPQVLVLSDDIYESILFDQPQFENILNVAPDLRDRCVILNGVSKAYAMTGWRIGYLAGPSPIMDAVAQVSASSTFTPCAMTQAAAVEALTGPQEIVAARSAIYRERRDLVLGRLAAMGDLPVTRPQGAFYAFPDCSRHFGRRTPDGSVISGDLDFALHCLQSQRLAVVHGDAFGTAGHVRLSFAASSETLTDAMDRLEAACACLT